MFVVKNGRKLPARFLPSASGGGPAEARAPTPEDVVDLYHGIGVSDLASLMENGFKPTMGAGSDALHNHFGTLVPGVYMAYDFATAMTYPMACTTREKVGGFRSGVQGGTLLAYDGTYPLRAVVRCVAKRGDHLWRRSRQRGNAQALYMPKSVFITHIFFYAVEPEMAHATYEEMFSYQAYTSQAEDLISNSRIFRPDCFHASVATLASQDEKNMPITASVASIVPLLPEFADYNPMKIFEPAAYLVKKLLDRWMNKKLPKIRLGTLSMQDPRQVKDFIVRTNDLPIPINKTSGLALEIHYKRGEKRRADAQDAVKRLLLGGTGGSVPAESGAQPQRL